MSEYVRMYQLLIIPVLIFSFCQCTKKNNFKIEGIINAESGIIFLNFHKDYISNHEIELNSNVKDGNFFFHGFITEPQSVFVLFDSSYMSSDFIIDKGNQTLIIDINSPNEAPTIKNRIMLEEYPKYEAYFVEMRNNWNSFYVKDDSLRKVNNYQLPVSMSLMLKEEYNSLVHKSNSVLLDFAKDNPSSIVAFWKLIRLMDWGYEPILDSIYSRFSTELKSGYAGRILAEKLHTGKRLSLGEQFPFIKVVNTDGKGLSADFYLQNNLTLVDFWYSRCGPCIAQFNGLRGLYSQFKEKKFEIVGISTDRIADENEWRNTVTKENLVWLQYWDRDGLETKRLSINIYPTNFLLDNMGRIIAKNLSVEELETYLIKNLK